MGDFWRLNGCSDVYNKFKRVTALRCQLQLANGNAFANFAAVMSCKVLFALIFYFSFFAAII